MHTCDHFDDSNGSGCGEVEMQATPTVSFNGPVRIEDFVGPIIAGKEFEGN